MKVKDVEVGEYHGVIPGKIPGNALQDNVLYKIGNFTFKIFRTYGIYSENIYA